VKISGSAIAAAFGRPDPYAKCVGCSHKRWQHRREILNPGTFDGLEAHYECRWPDRRTKDRVCKCAAFDEGATS